MCDCGSTKAVCLSGEHKEVMRQQEATHSRGTVSLCGSAKKAG
jgi:hypothetical protein